MRIRIISIPAIVICILLCSCSWNDPGAPKNSQANTKASQIETQSAATTESESEISDKEWTMEDAKESFYYTALTDEIKQKITGYSYPADASSAKITYDELSYVHVLHYDGTGKICEGELICNTLIAQDLVDIFYELFLHQYPIEKIRLIDEYHADDNLSMADNNTSCFNYRVVSGTNRLSNHSYGLAIDINPLYNPYITYNKDGSSNVAPNNATPYCDRTQSFPYKIDTGDLCYQLFIAHGFTWGGNWSNSKDYQHFEKKIN